MMNCKLSDQQMTLDSAIAHADQLASQLSGPCSEQHAQLAEWLRELQGRRNIEEFAGSRHESTLALVSVLDEMEKQDRQWGADRNQHPFIWGAILGEEVGELNQAFLHDEFGGSHAGTARAEAVQVAAVALQLIEYYDRVKIRK
ncbi:hypothetical protein ACTFJJ_07570 [Enterobacter roggenkampii]|uniref:hypothetical protein n=1 Tax=Enterobacter roggenkampii TaxID=1812935 RepID=UPI003F761D40